MIKRINRINALIVIATSMVSITPVMAKTAELAEQDGAISKAIAYKSGKYIYEGYKNDNEKGVYYNDGTSSTSEKKLDDIENLDNIEKFNGSYVSADPKENEQINLEDGSINNKLDSVEDQENIAKGKLRTKLSRVTRYGGSVNVKQIDSITKEGGFKNNIWYSYQAEVSRTYDESEFLVEDTNVYDENRFLEQTRVEISIGALWNSKFTIDGKEFSAGSSSKSSAKLIVKQILNANFDHYRVGQAAAVPTDNTGDYYKIVMTLLPKDNYEIPDELPEEVISMYDDNKKIWNTKSALQQYEMSATLFRSDGKIIQDTWSNEFDNKSRIEIDITALWNSKFRIAGKEFNSSGNNLAGVKQVKQELLAAQFDNYTVGQVAMLTSDGKFYHVKLILLPKDGVEIQEQLSDEFIAMLDNGNWKTSLQEWEMTAKATVVGKSADKSELTKLYDNHKNDNQGSYTNASWDVFTATLNNAKTVIDNEKATQDAVDLAKTNLNNAISGLEEITSANEYGTIITISISQFWAPIEIAGLNCSANWHVDTGNGNYNPNEVVTKLELAKETDGFVGGYKLISAVYNGSEVVVKLGLTEKLSAFPITVAKFNGSDLIEESWGGVHDSLWVVNASMETYDIQAQNSMSNSLATEITSPGQVQSVEMNIESVNAALMSKDDSKGKAIYYGYTDGEGNYIDCSYIANLTAFTGEGVVKFDKFNSTNTNYGTEIKLGLPKLIATLGQDKDYIYSLISVPVYGAKSEYGLSTIDEPLYYVQKISKEASSTKIDGAYIPKTVDTYQLNDNMISGGNGWSGDNWAYRNAKDYIINQYLKDNTSKIAFSNGEMYFVHMKTESNGDKKLEVVKIILKDSGKVILSNGTEVKEKNVMVDSTESTKEEPKDWTIDSSGNVWCVYNGKIQRSNQGKDFEDMYRVDSAINKLDVYDENNLIGWSTDADIYVTNKEGEIGTTIVTKTGWRKEADGKWHVHDSEGSQIKGWAKFGSGWYYFDQNGAMKTGWLELNGKTYYLTTSGIMQTGWFKVNSIWYYFSQAGEKQSNTNVDGYSLDESGALKN